LNAAWEKTLGYSIAELCSRPWLDFVHPDDWEATSAAGRALLEGEEVVNFENRYRHKDGSYRWLAWNTRPLPERQLIYGVAWDITERKRHEEERAELYRSTQQAQLAQEQFVQLAEASSDFIGIATLEGQGLFVNEAGQRLVGLEGTPISQVRVIDFFFEEDRDYVEGHILPQLLTDGHWEGEFRFRHFQTGDAILVWYNAFVIRDRQTGEPKALATVSRDIRASKRAEFEREALLMRVEASLGQLEAVVGAMSEGLIVSDLAGNVLTMNAAALRLHDYDSVEDVRQHLDKFAETFAVSTLDGQMLPVSEWPLARVLRGERFSDWQVRVRRLDSGHEWIGNYSGTPVRDLGGLNLAILTLRDVTEQKCLEREREEMLDRERRLKEAAEQARTQAVEANRAKDDFLAVLSHELRTPLNPIIGWTQLLRRGGLDARKQAEALETIERNAKLQNQLIADLLDVSRVAEGKLTLQPRPMALAPVVRSAIEAVRHHAEASGVHLAVDLAEAPRVNGDPTRLQQVVWNLLTNAIKFSLPGGRVGVRLAAPDGDTVRLTVEDNGLGIASEFLPHIFERFRQADGTRTRKQGGLGLGLFIVRSIVELHGGTVRAESAGEGRGAIFSVALPALAQ